MLVKYWMSMPAITVDAQDSLQRAVNLMKEKDVRMLPVLADGELAGVLTDRDIKRASPSGLKKLELVEMLSEVSNTLVKEIMSPDPVTARWDSTIEEVALELLLRKISGVPVVDDVGAVIGVITVTDIFDMLIALTGYHKRGIQFGLILVDKPGAIKAVTDLIRDHGARIASILTTRERAPRGYFRAFIRAYEMDRITGQRVKEVLHSRMNLLYIIDHDSNVREFYETDHPPTQETDNERI